MCVWMGILMENKYFMNINDRYGPCPGDRGMFNTIATSEKRGSGYQLWLPKTQEIQHL